MYVLMWDAELVTEPSPKQSKPHLDATTVVKFCVSIAWRWLTEYFVANLMLANKVSQELFIDAGLVDNLRWDMSVLQVWYHDESKTWNAPQCPRRYIQAQSLWEALVQPLQDWGYFPNQNWYPWLQSQGKAPWCQRREDSWPSWFQCRSCWCDCKFETKDRSWWLSYNFQYDVLWFFMKLGKLNPTFNSVVMSMYAWLWIQH